MRNAVANSKVILSSLAVVVAIDGRGAFSDGPIDQSVEFAVRSVKDGKWSDAATWQPAKVPSAGDRVLISRGTEVEYDLASAQVVRLVQVVGTLRFARDRDTELNVGILKVQDSDTCSESGFACEVHGVTKVGEPSDSPGGKPPALLVGTSHEPIPVEHTARIRLHFLEGMDANDAPAIACCSARMEFHGAPLARTWVKLGNDARVGQTHVVAGEPVADWHVGDDVIVTASKRPAGLGSYRAAAQQPTPAQTEIRRIKAIDGVTLSLDEPLQFEHDGSGEFRCEVGNLSRNVIVESAAPDGVRGHTVYHRFSRGGISYARFAHLGKEGVLGRYAIHFHLVGDTMRGGGVRGAAIVDSHNRWVTIHGTQYLVVRDCVGFQSVGHGFFLEDGTEVYNLLDRNLGVQAYAGRPLPIQVLPFDANEGAAFWWANGRNTFVRNVACENDQYGFRYDMQLTSQFDCRLPILQGDGTRRAVDVRTIPIWRFEDNEARTNFAGMVVAANGGNQPDAPIGDAQMLRAIESVDWTGPDRRHPHVIRGLTVWEAHYAFRPHSPCMLIDRLRIDRATYGVYRPALDHHVYRDVYLSHTGPEPFNRGMDDASAQTGPIMVDGLTIGDLKGGDQGHPVVHMTDNNLSGNAENHFRNVVWQTDDGGRPVFNRGGSVRVDPFVERGVPYFVHDYFGPGRHAKIVSTKAKDLLSDGNSYRSLPPLTGNESVVAEVGGVAWPELLDEVDDLAPATAITSVRREGGPRGAGERDPLVVRGVTHDNGEISAVYVNGKQATITSSSAGVVDWELTLDADADGVIVAFATDEAGNAEVTGHRLEVPR
ncbi:MAG TPA: G8 domain-containing protein [Pirellulales bacterium]|nr:G8 domain-containing protein [Pirellulales bacterium]